MKIQSILIHVAVCGCLSFSSSMSFAQADHECAFVPSGQSDLDTRILEYIATGKKYKRWNSIPTPDILEGEQLVEKGHKLYANGQWERSLQAYRLAEDKFSTMPSGYNAIDLMRLYLDMGSSLLELNKSQEAVEIVEKSLALARSLGDVWSESAVLNNLGNAYFRMSQFAQSSCHHAGALHISRTLRTIAQQNNADIDQLDWIQLESQILTSTSVDHMAVKQPAKAIKVLEEALDQLHPYDDPDSNRIKAHIRRVISSIAGE